MALMKKISKFKVAISGTVLLLLMGCIEVQYNIYATVEDIKLDNAFERGWIPLWLPNDAYNIHETHNIDIAYVALSFNVPLKNGFSWPSECEPVSNAYVARMETKLFPKQIHSLPNIRECGDLFVVMDSKELVHAWSTRGY